MSVDFTRPSLFRTILYFLIFYVIFRGRELLWPVSEESLPEMMPLARVLAGFLGRHIIWAEVLTFLLAFLSAFEITRILSRNLIFLERTYLPALVYLLVAMGYASSGVSLITLLVSLLVISAINNIIRSHKKRDSFGRFLHASVMLGVTPLLYAPSVVFVFLLPVGFIIYRRDWRSVVIALIGYLLPVFFCSYVFWGMKEPFLLTVNQIGHLLAVGSPGPLFIFRLGVWEYGLAGLILFLTIVGIARFSQRYKTMRSRAQNGYRMFLGTGFLALGMLALPCRSLEMLSLLAIPLAVLIPSCFNRQVGWWPNLLYLLLMGSFLMYNLIPYFQLFSA